MAATCPVAADRAAERLAAFVDAVAVGVAGGAAAIDHRRMAEAVPFLPGDISGTVGRRTFVIAVATTRATAAREIECHQREQKGGRQPQTNRVGGTSTGRLPANTNVDGGGVDPVHA